MTGTAAAPLVVPGPRRRLLRVALAAALAVLAGAGPALALTIQGPGAAAVEGTPFTGPVASFTDTSTVGCPAVTGYAASVVWADGSTAPATVATPVAGVLSCTYPLVASHTFAEEGSEPVAVTVSPATGVPVTATVPAAVSDAPLAAAGASLAATVGTPLAGAVATFTDAGSGAGAGAGAGHTAEVSWGDGSPPTAPTIAADPAGGGFTVVATHTYDRPGTFATMVYVADDGGSTASAGGVITVTAAAAAAPAAAAPAAPAPPATSQAPPLVGLSAPRLAGPRTISLRLACPASAPRCRGVARIVTRIARSAPVRAGTTLGSTLFVLAPGESRTLSIPVATRLRRALRRARAARVGGVAIAFAVGGHDAAATGPSAVILTAGLAR